MATFLVELFDFGFEFMFCLFMSLHKFCHVSSVGCQIESVILKSGILKVRIED